MVVSSDIFVGCWFVLSVHYIIVTLEFESQLLLVFNLLIIDRILIYFDVRGTIVLVMLKTRQFLIGTLVKFFVPTVIFRLLAQMGSQMWVSSPYNTSAFVKRLGGG